MSTDLITGGAVARGFGDREGVRWSLRRSSELFELRYGRSLVESTRQPGDIPVFGTNGRTGTHNAFLFPGPGVIIGRKGAGHLGVHWSDVDYWVIDTAYSLVPSPEVDLRFAYYLINYVGLNHLKHGTSNPSLTREAFGAQYFPVPPPAMQRSIAATLTALDRKIESNGRVAAVALRLLDSLAEQVAMDTRSVSLNALASLNRSTISPASMDGVAVAHFSLPAFDAASMPEVVEASTIKSNKIKIAEPSVLVSRLNPRIERYWWAAPGEQPALASTEFACLTACDLDALGGVWLAVRSPQFRRELPKRVTGTSGSHQRVRPEDLMSMLVPDSRELSRDVKRLALSLLELATGRRQESVALGRLRDALLPELLSGRMRVRETAEAVEETVG